MVSTSGFLHWWNLLFLIPLGVAVLLLLLGTVTGLGDDDGHGADGDGDGHGDVHGDGGHAGDGGDGDADHGDADGDHHGSNPLAGAFQAFGVGSVPVTLLLPGFLLFFGVAGLGANRSLNVAASPDSRIVAALLIALAAGLLGMALFGATARRFLPKDLPATASRDLLARTARVVFTVTPEGGTIQVRDAGGTLHQVPARVAPGDHPIEAGRDVILVSRDPETGVFTVDENPFS